MFELHKKKRYPCTHERELLIEKFTDFTQSDDDFEPLCLRGRHWGLIKLDIMDLIKGLED